MRWFYCPLYSHRQIIWYIITTLLDIYFQMQVQLLLFFIGITEIYIVGVLFINIRIQNTSILCSHLYCLFIESRLFNGYNTKLCILVIFFTIVSTKLSRHFPLFLMIHLNHKGWLFYHIHHPSWRYFNVQIFFSFTIKMSQF